MDGKIKLERNKLGQFVRDVCPIRYWLGKKRPSHTKKSKEKISKSLRDGFASGRIKKRYTRDGITLTKSLCLICGKQTSCYSAKTCRKHYAQYYFGERVANWKDGATAKTIKIRGTAKYKKWRNTVLKRDNYTCTLCGLQSRSGRAVELNADHIKPLTEIIHKNHIKIAEDADKCEELWNINNGRTLCVVCHEKTPTFGGLSRRNLTKEYVPCYNK